MKKKKVLLQCTVIIIAAALIIFGITQGEHMDVLRKAVRVCLECIGIG